MAKELPRKAPQELAASSLARRRVNSHDNERKNRLVDLAKSVLCRVPTVRLSKTNLSSAPTSNRCSALTPLLTALSSAGASCSALLPTAPPTGTSLTSSAAIATPSGAGVNASSPRALKACKTIPASGRPRSFGPGAHRPTSASGPPSRGCVHARGAIPRATRTA
jgi:hypothetical protein